MRELIGRWMCRHGHHDWRVTRGSLRRRNPFFLREDDCCCRGVKASAALAASIPARAATGITVAPLDVDLAKGPTATT